jgi:hypothetical protein
LGDESGGVLVSGGSNGALRCPRLMVNCVSHSLQTQTAMSSVIGVIFTSADVHMGHRSTGMWQVWTRIQLTSS